MKCPFCSQDNLVGAQFCDNCGASLKQNNQPQAYVAAARLEPAPPPTPIFPSRRQAAPAPVAPAAPAYAAAPAPVAPVYAAAPAPVAPAYAAAPAPTAPAYAAAPASAAPAYAAAPAPVAPTYAAAPAPAAPAYAAAPAPVTPAPAAPARGYAYFTDASSGQVFQLHSDKVLLGRGPGQVNDGFKLDFEGLRGGATVSKRHAVLRHDSTGIFIEDVGSGNGTFINDERLPQGIERGLNSGDRLRLGAVLLNFTIYNNKK